VNLYSPNQNKSFLLKRDLRMTRLVALNVAKPVKTRVVTAETATARKDRCIRLYVPDAALKPRFLFSHVKIDLCTAAIVIDRQQGTTRFRKAKRGQYYCPLFAFFIVYCSCQSRIIYSRLSQTIIYIPKFLSLKFQAQVLSGQGL